MVERRNGALSLGRRELVGAALAFGAASAIGIPARAAAGPWSERPAGKVDNLNFVVWTYGDIYTKISKRFTDDWGIPVDSTISAYNDQPAKLMTMYAGGEAIDVSQASPMAIANFISQGLVEPLDGLPGTADYAKDFTAFTKTVAVHDGKLMALPYYSTV